jgi:hypothetical protein
MAMKTTRLPKSASKSDDLNPLVFTDFVDTDENPRRGLGYHQLYDPTAFIGLLASLPDIPRTGDIVTLYWGINEVQRYEITDAMTEKGYLSFLVSHQSGSSMSTASHREGLIRTLIPPSTNGWPNVQCTRPIFRMKMRSSLSPCQGGSTRHWVTN